MSFRPVVKELKPLEPVRLVVAEAGDAEVWIGITPYGASGVSGGPNFYVGGPDIKEGLGLLVTSNEWSSELSEGDELWVMTAEALPFAETWKITALIRSANKSNKPGSS